MILKSEADRTEFELRLDGFQFPGNDQDEWDGNWLMISIRVDCPVASWTRTDPCLTTMEAHELVNWLGCHALYREAEPRIDFLEPNLSFELVAQDGEWCDLRLYFAAECHPPGVKADHNGREFFVPMRVRADELRQAANDLCRELRRFPLRAGTPRRVPECREV